MILHLTRGFTFYYDEWNFVVNRQYSTSDAFFGPHNEHMVLVPVLIFKALWAVAGLNEYWTFRVVVVALHLLVAGLLYVLARRRVGPVLALAPALILLFLGTAWEIILWPFEIQFLIPAAAGLGVLMAIEREDRAGDLVACGLLILAFASGSLGVPVALGAAVEILFGPRRFTRLLRVVVPAGPPLRDLAPRVQPLPPPVREPRIGPQVRHRAAGLGARRRSRASGTGPCARPR